MTRKSTQEDILLWEQLKELPPYFVAKEWQFDKARKWRFDFMVCDPLAISSSNRLQFGIEIEGGAFTQGRHTRGAGFVKDIEKYNHAALLGWRVLRFTPTQVLDGTAIAFIKKFLEAQ